MNTERVKIARRTMVLFFLVDTSGSMYGEKIGALNDAIRETVPDLKDLSDSNPDAAIKIAVLQFDSDVRWLYPQPIESGDFRWNDLEVGGLTSLGAALRELDSKLSKKQFLQEAAGSYAPVIILLSDGGPTDDFENALNQIKQNNWFKHAIKVAIAIGNDADKNVLVQFTGRTELVVEVHNKSSLKTIIKCVSVTSSQVNSKSSSVEDTSKEDDVAKGIGEALTEIPKPDDVEDDFN